MLAQSDLVQIAGNWVCGDCKPAFLSRVVAGTATSSRWHYGGFWIRFVAVFLDGLLMQVVRIPISLLVLGAAVSPLRTPTPNPEALTGAVLTLTGISMLIAVLYEATMIRYFGATLGKMAVGVKVLRTDGSGISWGISIARYFMKIVSAFILAIGYIMAGFDEEKRALHDRVCDTRVVYKRTIAAV
jgi:uncharacterized RDD family membrane protein YckC